LLIEVGKWADVQISDVQVCRWFQSRYNDFHLNSTIRTSGICTLAHL